MNGEPGLTAEAFTALKLKAEKTNHRIVVNLSLDEMAIRKHVQWDGRKYHGYVDFGGAIENDSNAIAKEALVFLVTAVNEN